MFLWISNNSLPFSSVLTLNDSHLVKDHLALDFLVDIFKWWHQEKGMVSLHSAIKKSNIESHLMSFVPDLKQSQIYFKKVFEDNGLDEILKLYYDQHQLQAKKELQILLNDGISEGKALRDIILELREYATKENIQEHETVCIIWTTIMALPEWNKKEVRFQLMAKATTSIFSVLRHSNNYRTYRFFR